MKLGLGISHVGHLAGITPQAVTFIEQNFDYVNLTSMWNTNHSLENLAQWFSVFQNIEVMIRISGDRKREYHPLMLNPYYPIDLDQFRSDIEKLIELMKIEGMTNFSFEYGNEPESDYMQTVPNWYDKEILQFVVTLEHARYAVGDYKLYEGAFTSGGIRGQGAGDWKYVWSGLKNRTFTLFTHIMPQGVDFGPWITNPNIIFPEIIGASISGYQYSEAESVTDQLKIDHPNNWEQLMADDLMEVKAFAERHQMDRICLFAHAYYFDHDPSSPTFWQPNSLITKILQEWNQQ